MAALVESIHRLDQGEVAWLQDVSRTAAALLPHAGIVVASRFAWDPGGGEFQIPHAESWPRHVAMEVQTTAHRAEQHFLKAILRAERPVFTLRSVFGAPAEGLNITDFLAEMGQSDMLCMFGNVAPSGCSASGVSLCATSPSATTLPSPALRSWQRIAAHLGAAARLRFADRPSVVEGVLAPDGRLLDARGAATASGSRDALRRAARAIERARLRDRRTDIPALLDAWRAVYERRWTLVETVESDGRRLLLARVNPPLQQGVPGGTERQQQIAALLAQGLPQKAIAFELQIAPSTVAFHVRRLGATLGVATVPELVARLREGAASS